MRALRLFCGAISLAASTPLLARTACQLFESASIVKLGSLRVTGDLAFAVPLASVEISDEVVLDLALEHRLVTDDQGQCRSTWTIPMLETSVYPRGLDRLYWTAPGGRVSILFMDGKRSLGPSDWQLASFSSEEIRIERGKWALVYHSGQLSSILNGRSILFSVDAGAGRIHTLTMYGHRLISAKYRPDRQPEALTIRSQTFLMIYDESGLRELRKGGGRLLAVEYQNGLLSEIRMGAAPPIPVEWSVSREFGRGDSPLRHSRWLKRFGDTEYDYRFGGEIIKLRSRSPRGVQKLYYNIVSGGFSASISRKQSASPEESN